MSFRKYGGLNFSQNNNIVRNNVLNSVNFTNSNQMGELNSKIVSENHIDLSGNSLLNTGNIYFYDGTVQSTAAPTYQNQIAIGSQSGQTKQGSYSVAIGYQAGNYNQGSYSVAIGYQAGNYNQANNSVAIGYNSSATVANTIVLGTTAETVYIPGPKLYVNNTQYTSDYRLKSDITELDDTYNVDNLRPIRYFHNVSKTIDFGLIAHELQEVFPNLVEGDKDTEKSQCVNYIGLIPILINEIKNLKNRVSYLENKQ
jgi:hypothetical protein